MAKKSTKGGKNDFFSPRAQSVSSRSDDGEGEGCHPQSDGFTKGETAILAALDKVNGRLAKVERAVQSLEETIAVMDSRIKVVETKSDMLEQRLSALDPQLQTLRESQSDYAEFKEKAVRAFIMMDEFKEQCDNDKRSANIRILGFPESGSENELAADIGEFLTAQVKPHGDKTPVLLDQVYRLPMKMGSTEGDRGGTVMVTLKNKKDREKILAAAASSRGFTVGDRKVLIFPDVGQNTLICRRELLGLRKQFIAKGAQASLWAPARLRIRHSNKLFMFTDPAAARKLLDSLPDAVE